MDSNEPTQFFPAGPTAPKLTLKDVAQQFWTDAYGKEVQTAATYSYTWLADQFGHICIGLILNFIFTALSGAAMAHWGYAPKWEYDTGLWPGLIAVIIIVACWEWRTYNSSVKQATGQFPLDTKLLRRNAIVATVYMALGGLLGFGFHLEFYSALFVGALVLAVAVALAPWWLRQKIIWQKASIPYLFRLADAVTDIHADGVKLLQGLINAGAPPAAKPCQIIIGGPIGSGRTSMAAGIATEFAFKNHKVRYLSLDNLLEFAVNSTADGFPNDSGPTTIGYWPWSQSELVIIDGIGPLLAVDEPGRDANFARFKAMLQNNLGAAAPALKQCHTVWVLGDLCPPPPRDQLGAVLSEFAEAVGAYCKGLEPPFVVELDSPPERPINKGALLGSTRRRPHAAKVRRVWRLDNPS